MDKTIMELEAEGKVRLARPGEQVVVRALNVIIKHSDLHRARAAGIEVKSQQDLDRFNSLHLPKIKTRAVVNFTGSGVNDMFGPVLFSSPTADDALEMVERDDFLGKSDILAYYLQFA